MNAIDEQAAARKERFLKHMQDECANEELRIMLEKERQQKFATDQVVAWEVFKMLEVSK